MKPFPELLTLDRGLPPVHDGTGMLPARLRGAVMLLGSFDGLHRGHAVLVEAGREKTRRNGVPLAIMQCDPHPRAFFAGASRFRVSTGVAQMRMLAETGMDFVYAPRFDAAFAAMSPEDFVRNVLIDRLGVTEIITGRDFRFGRDRRGDVVLLSTLSSSLPFDLTVVGDEIQDENRISTTAVRKAILAGDIAAAERLLGHRWLTEIHRTADGVWRFAAEQILPPPGLWKVAALDAAGRYLADCLLELDTKGSPCIPAPVATAMLAWRPERTDHAFLNFENRDAYA